jgi:hypothetical protein
MMTIVLENDFKGICFQKNTQIIFHVGNIIYIGFHSTQGMYIAISIRHRTSKEYNSGLGIYVHAYIAHSYNLL